MPAIEGETVAAALTAAGITALRRTRGGEPRGVFCGMGVCHECLVTVDARPGQRACMTEVREGMSVAAHRDDAPAGAAAGMAPSFRLLRTGWRTSSAISSSSVRDRRGSPAAEAAARAGVLATVLDERPNPGGQYFKQLAPSHRFAGPRARDRQFASGADLIERVRAAGAEISSSATVWSAHATGRAGAAAGGGSGAAAAEVEVVVDGSARRIRARQLVIAAGAYERAHPVPGWTLPGVMTTGAAQTLARAYRVAPGARVLVAGNGPLNLQVACELAAGGVEVAAVAEAAPPPAARARRGPCRASPRSGTRRAGNRVPRRPRAPPHSGAPPARPRPSRGPR